MPTGDLKQNKVELPDPDSPWTRSVLEAAETLAGKPMEVKGPQGQRYFVAPNRQLANLCRRWLRPPPQIRTLPTAELMMRRSSGTERMRYGLLSCG